MKIAILVPFYNENKNLKSFVNEWHKYRNFFTKSKISAFFFFIDDGSSDNSVDTIKENAKKIKYKIIKKKNSGHGDSCKYGYKLILQKYKDYEYILQIDSDNQCDPKYLPKIYKLIRKKNYNFIFGYRKKRKDGFVRYIISKILSLTILIKKRKYIPDLNTPYRIMKADSLRKIIKEIEKKKNYKNIDLYNCLLTYYISRIYKIHWISIYFRERYFGKSKFNLLRMLKMYFQLILKL
jgi:dolichol-phosphate mannosyltransferase